MRDCSVCISAPKECSSEIQPATTTVTNMAFTAPALGESRYAFVAAGAVNAMFVTVVVAGWISLEHSFGAEIHTLQSLIHISSEYLLSVVVPL